MTRNGPWTWVMLSALAMFVPLPFVDAWMARIALRRALRADAPEGQPFDERALHVLTEDRDSLLLGCLWTILVWPLKKLFRTLFWFLTVKDVIDRVAYCAQVVAMVRLARAEGWLPEQARAVRDGMEVAFGKHQWSPVMRLLLRKERPALPESGDNGTFATMSLSLRRHAGGAIMDELFLARVRDEIAATPSG